MIRQLCTAAAVTLALASAAGAAERVEVLGRTWIVEPSAEMAGGYAATRIAPVAFAPPPKLKVVQAMRAIRAATGCTPNFDGMYSTISGTYHAPVICPK
jgi:hypothetical protein